jgi:hypothetical protein
MRAVGSKKYEGWPELDKPSVTPASCPFEKKFLLPTPNPFALDQICEVELLLQTFLQKKIGKKLLEIILKSLLNVIIWPVLSTSSVPYRYGTYCMCINYKQKCPIP